MSMVKSKIMYIFKLNICTHLQVPGWKLYSMFKAVKHTVQRFSLIQGCRSFWVSGRRRSILSADPASHYCTLPSCPKQSLFFRDANTHTHSLTTASDFCFREKQSFNSGDKFTHMVMRSSPGWNNTYAHKQLLCHTHAHTQGAKNKDWDTDTNIDSQNHTHMHAQKHFCFTVLTLPLANIRALALDLALALALPVSIA